MLREDAAAVLAYSEDHPAVSPQRVAAMLFRTRAPRKHRALAMVTDRDGLAAALRAVVDGAAHPSLIRTEAPAAARRHAFVFPGQGGQRPGMGRLYYESAPAFRAEVDRCDAIFQELFGASPRSYLLDPDTPADDGAQIVQPALFMQMTAMAAMWRAVGVEPAVTVGHSQGEIAAAYVSGTMSQADAALVVGARARAVDDISSDDYAMAVVAASREDCEDVLARQSGWAQVSVVNAPRMVGISGDRATVEDLVADFTERGAFARLIRVRYPAHTGMVNQFRDALRDTVRNRLTNPSFLASEIPCIGATLGDVIPQDLSPEDYWFLNLRNAVRFDKAIATAMANEADTFVELAEHPTLQLSVQENVSLLADGRETRVIGTASRDATDLTEFTRNLAVVAVHDLNYPWDRLHTETAGPPPLPLLDFPNVPMNELRLWLPYRARTQQDAPAPAARIEAAAEISAPELTSPAQLLVEDWVRLTKRSLSPPRRIGIFDHTGDRPDLIAALCEAADRHGADASPVGASDTQAAGIDTLLIVLPAPTPLDDRAAAAAIAEFLGARPWWPRPTGSVTDCWLVTAGGESVVTGDAPPHPVHAAAGAGFRAVGAEYPGIAFRHLDLSPEQYGPDSAAAIITAIHTAGETELALREGNLYAKRLVEPARPDTSASVFDNILIIGGTGKLGLEFGEHFARNGSRRITLVSRSGESPAVAERLAAIRRAGSAEIRVVSGDVGDETFVARSASEHFDTPVDLVIHAAVDYADVDFADITPATVERASRAKIIGLANVLDSIPRTDDCRVLLCSSMAATVGGRGQAVYAATNRMLDAIAHRLRAEGLDCVSVQWGQWTAHLDLGISGAAKLAGVGALPMRPEDAIALGLGARDGNVIVAGFDWDRARSALDAYGYGPLLSQLTTPSITARVTTPQTPAVSGHDQVDLSNRLVKLLAEVIGVDDADSIDTTVPMVALGLDSLQALDFRRRVNAEFDCDLPVADLLGGACVRDVVRVVELESKHSGPAKAVTPVAQAKPVRRAATVVRTGHQVATTPADIARRAKKVAEQAVDPNTDIERIRSARVDLDIFGMHAMMSTLRPAFEDGAAHTAAEIAARVEFAPRHHWLLQRWLDELTAHECLDLDAPGGYRPARPVPTPVRADLFEVSADLGYSREFATFLESSNAHLTELAQDRVRVQELLFPDGDMLTAEAAYRENTISHYLNLAAREVVAGLVERLRGDRSPVRILELGAGIGGTTDEVVRGLPGLPVDYHFTDLSTFFLAAAQERFTEYPWMRYGIMDLNADLSGQQHYDIVLAANVVHNAHHIGEALRRLRDLIDPGGAVIFIEACRANYQLLTSMKFLMSAGAGQPHPGVDDVREGKRIFLRESEWHDELRASGFTPMLTLPEAGHPMHLLDQRIFAAIRD
ncbi:nocobactin polyketide synthase NbtC [Nocardia bovistercoris]|uniref:nocobactin polyketide synthase NbtC n=1 Tax=Nocardia bovistercoris TaxID=2785916 RepID=UPI0038CD2E43